MPFEDVGAGRSRRMRKRLLSIGAVCLSLLGCGTKGESIEERLNASIEMMTGLSREESRVEKERGASQGDVGFHSLRILQASTLASLQQPTLTRVVLQKVNTRFELYVHWVGASPNCDNVVIRVKGSRLQVECPVPKSDQKANEAQSKQCVHFWVGGAWDLKDPGDEGDVAIFTLLMAHARDLEVSLQYEGRTIASITGAAVMADGVFTPPEQIKEGGADRK